MWVRSQNKIFLGYYKFFWIDGKQIKGSSTAVYADFDILGEYETYERALEVLDSIQCEIMDNNNICDIPLK